jgi:hypothetical protein
MIFVENRRRVKPLSITENDRFWVKCSSGGWWHGQL